ncbi:MAG: ATPase, T2SS/T4P/T4SS family [Acidimicrobiia bacterium]|nr:ATPase, T2SS/T4P/T4SS family [Acidimicrobiia bacterium]MDH4308135.1 ATPase, T2SS/T4P/T4SS family [Acidimicrobiia bacterium]MDH5293586.1 ATPase, T2SS/T4P/T4SS family [Acidimicrobiia bacterium]
MGLIERLSDALIASEVPIERRALGEALTGIAAEQAPLATAEQLESVVDALVGLGPLEVLLRDPEVTDVLVNGPADVWVERKGVLSRTRVRFADDDAVVAAVERTIAPLGLRFDRAAPMVDARLADGSRLHAVRPPAAVGATIVAIRRFSQAVPSLTAMVDAGTMSPEQAAELRDLVRTRVNVLVSGGTGAGKTTLLNVLSTEIPDDERVVVIEDASELRLAGHVVRLEARPPNSEGAGEITVRRLVRSALRLRPDRIVLGEVRGQEALELIGALNTGHAGSMSTVHANSPEEALWRLETLALTGSARVGSEAIKRQLRAAIGAVIQLERRGGVRRVVEISRVAS